MFSKKLSFFSLTQFVGDHIMWARISLCISVALALLVVILLAVLTPKPRHSSPSTDWLDLSLYIQEPRGSHSIAQPETPNSLATEAQADAAALVFHRTLTEGPENTSKIVGKAQGFIIPAEDFARSDFNVVYLSFDTPQYSGSLSVRFSGGSAEGDRDKLTVVGGTGSFAFARGLAVFAARSGDPLDASYLVKLQLRFPNNNDQSPPMVPVPG